MDHVLARNSTGQRFQFRCFVFTWPIPFTFSYEPANLSNQMFVNELNLWFVSLWNKSCFEYSSLHLRLKDLRWIRWFSSWITSIV